MTEHLPVYYEDFLVGELLTTSRHDLSFTYADRWLASRNNFPLSLTMPLRKTEYQTATILPWLSNILPEESMLKQVAQTLKVGTSNSVAILSEIGGDTAGALSFGNPIKPQQWKFVPLEKFYSVDNPLTALAHHFDDIKIRPFLAGLEGVRVSLAGGQRKTVLSVIDSQGVPVYRFPHDGDSLAVNLYGAPSTLIVKPSNPNFQGIVENEVWCLRMAKAIGIDAAEATIIGEDNCKAIATLRFDRKMSDNNIIKRIHQEDFAQANSLYPYEKYETDKYGLTLADLFATSNRCHVEDKLALLDQIIFNILVANTDAHAKNYSIQLSNTKTPKLTPIYDVISILNWKTVSRTYAQRIGGRSRTNTKIAGRHWKKIAEDCGLRPTELLARVEELSDLILSNITSVTNELLTLHKADKSYVIQTAKSVEENIQRMKGKLHL